MSISKPNRVTIGAVAALAVVITIFAWQLFAIDGDVAAHQPEGLGISQTEVTEPPCPYGHDDACENAPLALGLTAFNPYQSPDPHAALPSSGSVHYHRVEIPDNIRDLTRQLNDEGVEPGGVGGDNGVSYAITSDITRLPWVRDGQTPSERITVAWLSLLQEHNPSLVRALTRMPFLQDHTPGDREAIATLALISQGGSQIPPAPGFATNIVYADGFADGGGVDNTEAKIIAVMGIAYFRGDTVLVELLPEYGTVEEQNVTGRYGNRINFAVVRMFTSRQNSKLMRAATTGVSDAETLMGQPLPTDFVGILAADIPGAVGANNSINIQVSAGFDNDYYSDRYRQLVVAHEIGHYWWSPNNDHEHWISEGAAQYIGAYSVKSQFNDGDVFTEYYPCPYYRTIEHMRADSPQYALEGSYGSLCNYSLGERLFINLNRSLGDAAFTTSFRNLHRRLSTYETDEIDQGLSLVRAFCAQCQQQQSRQYQINLPSAGHVLARRYGEKVFTDHSTATGSISGLGRADSVSIEDYSGENRQYGIAQIPASSPDQRRWVTVFFDGVYNPPKTVKILIDQYHEERQPWVAWPQEQQVYCSEDRTRCVFYAYLGAPQRHAIGHHWVHIYNDRGQKIAEVEYQVTP